MKIWFVAFFGLAAETAHTRADFMNASRCIQGIPSGCRKIGGVLFFLLTVVRMTAANHDEAIDGDISNDRLAPTVVLLTDGPNMVKGNFGRSPVPDVADLDYFTVRVPAGHRLDAVNLVDLNPGGANSFLGAQAGPQMTMPSTSHDPSPLLGWAHIYKNQIGSDLLPAMSITGPLAAGDYTFWSNETDTSAAWSYAFDFQVSALAEAESVPLPEWSLILLAAGLAAVGRFRLARSGRGV